MLRGHNMTPGTRNWASHMLGPRYSAPGISLRPSLNLRLFFLVKLLEKEKTAVLAIPLLGLTDKSEFPRFGLGSCLFKACFLRPSI